jgi:hypothetical protein
MPLLVPSLGNGAFFFGGGVVCGVGGTIVKLLVLKTNFSEAFFIIWSMSFVPPLLYQL